MAVTFDTRAPARLVVPSSATPIEGRVSAQPALPERGMAINAPDAPAAPHATSFERLAPKTTLLREVATSRTSTLSLSLPTVPAGDFAAQANDPTRAERLAQASTAFVPVGDGQDPERVLREVYRQLVGARGTGQAQAIDAVAATVLAANREASGPTPRVLAVPGWTGVHGLLDDEERRTALLASTRTLDLDRLRGAAGRHPLPEVTVPAERSVYRTRADDRLRDIVAKAYSRQIETIGGTPAERESLLDNLVDAVALHNALLLSGDGVGVDSGPAGRALARLRFHELRARAGATGHILLPPFREMRRFVASHSDEIAQLQESMAALASPPTRAQLRLAKERVRTWAGEAIEPETPSAVSDPNATRVAALRLIEHTQSVDHRGRLDPAAVDHFASVELRALGLADARGKLQLDAPTTAQRRALLVQQFEAVDARLANDPTATARRAALRAHLALLLRDYDDPECELPSEIDHRTQVVRAYNRVRDEIDASERDRVFQVLFAATARSVDAALAQLLAADQSEAPSESTGREETPGNAPAARFGTAREVREKQEAELARLADEAKRQPITERQQHQARKDVMRDGAQDVYAAHRQEQVEAAATDGARRAAGPVSAWRHTTKGLA